LRSFGSFIPFEGGFGPPFLWKKLRQKMKKILDTDPLMGTTSIFHGNDHDETYAVETRQDVTQIIKEATEARNLTSKNTPYKGDGWHKVGTIPMTMYAEWQAKGYTKDQKKFRALVNDPNFRYFRTREGKV
jgi:hypothetical protein|tara:strand:+ start:2852 stop:3244 length:393 start_codon:yes stop_codon:yes gene_type:complete